MTKADVQPIPSNEIDYAYQRLLEEIRAAEAVLRAYPEISTTCEGRCTKEIQRAVMQSIRGAADLLNLLLALYRDLEGLGHAPRIEANFSTGAVKS